MDPPTRRPGGLSSRRETIITNRDAPTGMEPSDLILLVLNKKGRVIPGRTALQKTVYFAANALKYDLRYKPHFYGPYSSLVASTTEFLSQTDFVREDRREERQDFVQYAYSLSDDGRKAAETAKNANTDAAKRIEKVVEICEAKGGNDPRILSFAAKVHHLIKGSGGRVWTAAELIEKGKSIGWEMNAGQIRSGVDLLVDLGLVKLASAG